MAGRIDWAKYIEKLYEAMDKHVNDMLYTTFSGLNTSLSAGFELTTSVTITAEDILNLVEKVSVSTGKDVMICGPRAALSKISTLIGATYWSEDMKDQRNTLGFLQQFEGGVPLVRIPQVFSQNTRTFAYPQNKFYVLPMTDDKPIKLVYEGETYYEENTEASKNRDMTVEAEYMTKFGIGVVFGSDFGIGTFAS